AVLHRGGRRDLAGGGAVRRAVRGDDRAGHRPDPGGGDRAAAGRSPVRGRVRGRCRVRTGGLDDEPVTPGADDDAPVDRAPFPPGRGSGAGRVQKGTATAVLIGTHLPLVGAQAPAPSRVAVSMTARKRTSPATTRS